MEELSASLSSSVRVSLEDNDTCLIHPRYAQYKAKPTNCNQEERRKQWLQDQKQKRMELFNIRRGIEENDDSIIENMELEVNSTKKFKKRIFKVDKPYEDWLMLSEWLIDIPEDLSTKWYCTMCPDGKRSLIVANKGSTYSYSRRGEFIMKFPSALPGGSSDDKRGYTVLDCIYNHQMKTFYLLDVLIWGVPFTNCEAELRFYWLSCKFLENPALSETSLKNRFKFNLLEHKSFDQLSSMLNIYPAFENNYPNVDGILFYHKESLYTNGKSPLVTWLKPFMVPDILGISVAQPYVQQKPIDYPNCVQMDVEVSKIKDDNPDKNHE